MSALFRNPLFWEILAALLAAIWSFPRVAKWRKEHLESKWQELVGYALEAVNSTYLEYVQGIKRGREDGKLTREEIRKARQMAWSKLHDIVREQAPELLDRYGEEAILLAIQSSTNMLKKGERND